MSQDKSAAIVTVIQPGRMTPQGRKDIARWIRRQASLLERHADKLGRRFVARYLYVVKEDKR